MRVVAREHDVKRIERCISTQGSGVRNDVDTEHARGPRSLVDLCQFIANHFAQLAYQGRHGGDPRAVLTILLRPPSRAKYRRGLVEGNIHLGPQAGYAPGEAFVLQQLLAVFKIFQAIVDQHHIVIQQVALGPFGGVSVHRRRPGGALGRRESIQRQRCRVIRLNGHCCGPGCSQQTALEIKPVMEVDPKAAVKFKRRQRRTLVVGLGEKNRWIAEQNGESQQYQKKAPRTRRTKGKGRHWNQGSTSPDGTLTRGSFDVATAPCLSAPRRVPPASR